LIINIEEVLVEWQAIEVVANGLQNERSGSREVVDLAKWLEIVAIVQQS